MFALEINSTIESFYNILLLFASQTAPTTNTGGGAGDHNVITHLGCFTLPYISPSPLLTLFFSGESHPVTDNFVLTQRDLELFFSKNDANCVRDNV